MINSILILFFVVFSLIFSFIVLSLISIKLFFPNDSIGNTGPQGPQGPKGPKGDDSNIIGPQGPQGPQGPKGEDAVNSNNEYLPIAFDYQNQILDNSNSLIVTITKNQYIDLDQIQSYNPYFPINIVISENSTYGNMLILKKNNDNNLVNINSENLSFYNLSKTETFNFSFLYGIFSFTIVKENLISVKEI